MPHHSPRNQVNYPRTLKPTATENGGTSPFYWPYPHESSSSFYGGRTLEFMQWADGGRRTRDRIEYRYEGEGFIGDESFVRVTVDLQARPKSGLAEVFGRKGERFPEYERAFEF